MRGIDKIIIHCSATPNGRPVTVQEIDAWHRVRGFKRMNPVINSILTAIGYHFIIRTGGTVETGRGLDEVGAHAEGYNAHSIGICMAGTDCFTQPQWLALSDLVYMLQKCFPEAAIIGHRDLPDVKKTCPGFDVGVWLAQGMGPLEGHTISG